MTLVVIALFSGLTVGSIYAAVGVGYTVVFNATKVLNLAQGSLLLVSVMVSWYLLILRGWSMPFAAAGAVAATTIVALLEERLVVRRFLTRTGSTAYGWFIATLGFSLVVESLLIVKFGNAIRPIPSPFDHVRVVETTGRTSRYPKALVLGDVVLEHRRVFAVVVVALTIALLQVFFARTWTGQAMRATSEDRDAATLLGVSPRAVSRGAFALAGLVTGVAGVVLAPITSTDPRIGLMFTLKGFVALAIGGFGSVPGAIAGGIGLGVAEQLWDLKFPGGKGPNYEILVGLILLLVVLTLRPAGLVKGARARSV